MNQFELFIYKNVDIIFSNFIKVFNMNKEEVLATIKNLITILKKDQFYSNYKKFFITNFSLSNLNNLKEYLLKHGLSENEIKKTIIRMPGMIFLNETLENIYLIFKGKQYKGYVVFNNNDIKSYVYLGNSDLICGKNNNYYENEYIIKEMLKNANREDVSEFLNIQSDYKIKEKLDCLKEDFCLKNYYLKK